MHPDPFIEKAHAFIGLKCRIFLSDFIDREMEKNVAVFTSVHQNMGKVSFIALHSYNSSTF
jgi:hypothetical protein